MKFIIICIIFTFNGLAKSETTDLIGIKEAIELDRYISTCISKTNKIEELSSTDQEYIEILKSIDAQIQKITNPRILFIMKVILFESWAEGEMGFETTKGRLIFHAAGSIVLRLAKLGTQEAYREFLNLKKIYGQDAGGLLYYNDLELEYFKSIKEIVQ